jgi:predicted PurR-regulated permease PerM
MGEVKSEEEYLKKITTTIILVLLIGLSFFLLRSLLMSIAIGIILAAIFSPIYRFILKYLKNKDVSAIIICIFVIALIIIPLWFLTPILVNESIKIYQGSQQIDFVTPLKTLFPSMFQSEQFANSIGSALYSFVTKTTNSLMNSFSDMVVNFPELALQLVVVFFVFYFVLRDQDLLVEYIQSLLPFTKEIEKRIFKSSKDITFSVLYGQIIMGILQGLIVGIGFFIFNVPSALFLTLAACVSAILPIIGATLIWIPVAVYLIIGGNSLAAFGVAIFGSIAWILDHFIKPSFISRRTEMNSALVFLGMIGGLLVFGLLGIVLGPLILAYLFIVLELYRHKSSSPVFVKPEDESK